MVLRKRLTIRLALGKYNWSTTRTYPYCRKDFYTVILVHVEDAREFCLIYPDSEDELIRFTENRGLIRITGRTLENDVIIQVIDNGLGIDEETLRNILVAKRTDESKRVGVQNVHNRLQ